MTGMPETRFVRTSDGALLAYQDSGSGPPALVLLVGWGGNVEGAWALPPAAELFGYLTTFSRLLMFDPRGTGVSDPLARNEEMTVESRARDLLAVLDEAGVEHVVLVANNLSGGLAVYFAATYPHRTQALVLDGCFARFLRAPDYPWGYPEEVVEEELQSAQGRLEGWHDARAQRMLAPVAMSDPAFATAWLRFIRSIDGPSQSYPAGDVVVRTDVRALLPAVQAPTLVLYRRDDQFVGRPHAVYLAEHIAGARLVELPGRDNLVYAGDVAAFAAEVEEFLTGARRAPEPERVLATVLFTDIVGSTEQAARLGDRAWRELLERHHAAVRRELARHRGQERGTAGDGFLATFDGPGRAIACAAAIRGAVASLGLQVRAGLHTGEVELHGADVAGLAVHIGARVSALAGPDEVLVSSTVKDLVTGSGTVFTERGEHALKGVPGRWRVFAVSEP